MKEGFVETNEGRAAISLPRKNMHGVLVRARISKG
jgi:hypothetical protein